MKIKREIIEKIILHAKKDAPVEACGYLAQKDDIVIRHYELTNVDKSNEHFSFDPHEQFQAVKDARAGGLEVCAAYHSHPHSPARPSNEDIKLAYDPQLRYVIISLANGKEEVRSFKINDTHVEQETIEVIDDD